MFIGEYCTCSWDGQCTAGTANVDMCIVRAARQQMMLRRCMHVDPQMHLNSRRSNSMDLTRAHLHSCL